MDPVRRPYSPRGVLAVLAVAGAAATGAAPAVAVAQSLGGVVLEEGTGTPVVGALLVAADSTGAPRGRTLTRADGTFLLRLPASGSYTVDVQRIGIRSQTSASVVVQAGAPAYLRIEAGQEPVELEEISVTAERSCRVAAEAGEHVARVWDEVRKALETAVVAGEESLLSYRIERFERTLEAEGLRVVDGSTTRRTVMAEYPFRGVDAEELREHGFIRADGDGYVYLAPDAEALLSSAFLDTHCLRLVEASDPERIAMGFEPVPGRMMPDIEGRIVVDRASGVLERLEFRYVRSPTAAGPAAQGLEGGSIRFIRAPNGVLVPADWRIRMASGVRSRGRFQGRELDGMVVTELQESGGRIVGIRDGRGDAWSVAGGATLTGRVVRAGRGGPEPLSGARVRVEGTAYATVTDAEGRYRLAGLAAGRYAVRAWHPVLDSLPWPDEPTTVAEVADGGEVRADVTVPTEEDLLDARCEGHMAGYGGAPGSGIRVVFGSVRNAGGTSLPGARVVVSWGRWATPAGAAAGLFVNRTTAAETVADSEGRFVVCGLPEEERLTLEAGIGDLTSDEATVEDGVRIQRVDLVIAGEAASGRTPGDS